MRGGEGGEGGGAHIIKLELGGCRTKGRQNDGPKDMTKKGPANRRGPKDMTKKRPAKRRGPKDMTKQRPAKRRAKRHDKETAGKMTGQKT